MQAITSRSQGAQLQRDAHTELHNYSSRWSSESDIKSITLYAVNALEGSYSTFVSGTIDQVAVALGSTA